VGTRTNGFFPVIFLTLIVFISVAALTLTDAITKDKIELAKEDEIARMLITLFPQMDGFTYDEQNDLYIPLAEQQPLGRAFMAEQSGYSGVISILVGLEPGASRGRHQAHKRGRKGRRDYRRYHQFLRRGRRSKKGYTR
jgi:hypothetical protein